MQLKRIEATPFANTINDLPVGNDGSTEAVSIASMCDCDHYYCTGEAF